MGMLGIDVLATVNQLTGGLVGKVDKVTGKGLSTEDFSSDEKTKLAGIQAGAQVNPDLSGYATTAALNSGLAGKAATSHGHAIGDVSGLQTALDGKQAALGFTPESSANKGLANGYAALDSNGLVPSAQLPSYVDDVLEYADFASLPGSGESGKIYVLATPYTSGGTTSSQFRWSGSAYAPVIASPGSTDSVTEGSANLYFTTARASAAAPVQSVAGKTSAVTLVKGDVGLGNVDNTSDANKPVSTAQAAALALKAELSSANFTELLLANKQVAAVDYGSNANGRWIKWYDKNGNTLACFQHKTGVSIGGSAELAITFPVAFPDANVVPMHPHVYSGNSFVVMGVITATTAQLSARNFAGAGVAASGVSWGAWWTKS